MNILQTEDMIKGLPDDRLMQEAHQPTGQIPQFLVISEIQRRTDMRKRYQNAVQQMPEGTVKDKIIQEGIASMAPAPAAANTQSQSPQTGQQPMPSPSPQMGPMPPQLQPPMPTQTPRMAGGGVVRMAAAGQVPANMMTFVYNGKNYTISKAGYPTDQAAYEAFLSGQNAPVSVIEGGWNDQWSNDLQFNLQGDYLNGESPANVSRGDMDFAVQADLNPQAPNRSRATFENATRPEGGTLENLRQAGSDYANALGESWNQASDLVYGPWFRASEKLGGLQSNSKWRELHPWLAKTLDAADAGLAAVGDKVSDAFDVVTGGAEQFLANQAIEQDKSGLETSVTMGEGRTGVLGALTDPTFWTEDVPNAAKSWFDTNEYPMGSDGKPKTNPAAVSPEAVTSDEVASPAPEEKGLESLAGVNSQLLDAEGESIQGSALDKLMGIADRQSKQGWNQAMVQLGAGIASNNLGGGLSKAGLVMGANARETADMYSKAAAIQSADTRMQVQYMIQQGESDTAILRFVGGRIDNILADLTISFNTPQERVDYIKKLIRDMLPPRLANQMLGVPDKDKRGPRSTGTESIDELAKMYASQ